jgi:two-component SAPR family response regulator
MSTLQERFDLLQNHKKEAILHVQSMGTFKVWREDVLIHPKEWGRDKTLQLFQFFLSNRHRHGLHKEQIIDRIWEDASDQDFKVALHGVNKTLEPERESRTDPSYIIRDGLSYHLNLDKIWLDIEMMEQYIIIANEAFIANPLLAKESFREALNLHQGIYLPSRLYEDWSSEERERTQVLILGAYITMAEMTLDENPMESIRLSQNALTIDPCWEDAYRIQMQAYLLKGNRPQAIKTYQTCVDVLDREYGIDPLPETKKLLQQITSIS